MGHYQVGQACLNGHSITSNYEGSPELRAPFCSQCGEKTIHSCPNCQTHIRGWYHVSGVLSLRDWEAPAFCHACGSPYPWTERQIQAAKDLADEIIEIDRTDLDKAKAAFIALTSDTPQTQIAAFRVKKLLDKAGPSIGGAIKEILIGLATEGAKRAIGW